MAKESSSTSNGIGFFGILFIVFLVLKLTHVIDWSWWWVTAPLWGPFGFALLCLVLYIAIDQYQIRKRGKRRHNLWDLQ